MAMPSFDKYSLHARLFPALIVLLPVGFTIACFFPDKFIGWDFLVGLATAGGISIFLEQLARDQGKVKEPILYKMWGGEPTTNLLRHEDSTLDPVTLNRYHQKLNSIVQDVSIPSIEEEQNDSEKADQIYKSCVVYLKENTRDKENFPLIFAENVNYGFRRNLWGMKGTGITVVIISTLIILVYSWVTFSKIETLKPVVLFTLLMDIGLLVIWTMRVTPDWIRTVAYEYAERLLAACDSL